MEDVAQLEARLEQLAELGELVRALRSMAGSRAREAQAALAGTSAYRGTIGQAIAGIAPLVPEGAPSPGEPGAAVRIVVTSENGFVGGFNTRLVDTALESARSDERLVVVGRRGQVTLGERGRTPDLAVSMTPRTGGVTTLARRLAAALGPVDRAEIVFARARPGAGTRIERRPVLPLRAPSSGPATAWPPLHHLPVDELLRDLSAEYLFAEIADALMESLAAENDARLRTMDAASRNIEERLEALRRRERVARQEQTTSDMLEVVTGAEAVNRRG